MAPDVVVALQRALPQGAVVTDPDIVESHARDQAGSCPAGRPLALVWARSVEDVQTTLRLAAEHRTPVVPRGAGTGLSGGANGIEGGISLSVEKMNRILEIDPSRRIARVEPGVLNGDLDALAREHGLMYAPDPASRAISTIGGNVATNAGGACCLRYGVTGDHVARIEAVLAGGERIHTGSLTRKNVTGLDLNRLLIGSEGTLAVITEVTVRLLPKRPALGTLAAFFPDLESAGAAIVALAAADRMSRLEVMDRTTLEAVEAMVRMELDTSAAAMVLAQADGADAAEVLSAAERACNKAGASFVAVTEDEAEGRMFFQARSAAYPALERLGACLLDDVAVPVPEIPRLLARCAAIGAAHSLTIGTFGHAGDGNLHPTLVYPPGDAEAEARAQLAFVEILDAALEMGGTLTGEHGIGQLKVEHVEKMVGRTERALMHGIKKAFDPLGILNPGRAY